MAKKSGKWAHKERHAKRGGVISTYQRCRSHGRACRGRCKPQRKGIAPEDSQDDQQSEERDEASRATLSTKRNISPHTRVTRSAIRAKNLMCEESTVDKRPTEMQRQEIEIVDSNPNFDNLAAQEETVQNEDVDRQTSAMQIARDALLALDDNSPGFVESKPRQGQLLRTSPITQPRFQAGSQFRELPLSTVSVGPQRTGLNISSHSANLDLVSPAPNPKKVAYPLLAPRLYKPPLSSVALSARPPAVTFTDSCVISTLLLEDFNHFWTIFSRNSRVLFESAGRDRIYYVETLMRKSALDFFTWHGAESGSAIAVSTLTLELLDCNGRAKNTFRVSRHASVHFHLVKQAIWDVFWTSYLDGASDCFSIYVTVPDDNLGHDVGLAPTPIYYRTAPHSATRESNIHDLLN